MKKNGTKGKTTRKPTKAEVAQQKKVRDFWLRCVAVILLIFGAARLGAVGMLVYNSLRFLVGSTVYGVLAIFLLFLVLERKMRSRSLIWGAVLLLAGCVLGFQAYFVLEQGKAVGLDQMVGLAWGQLIGMEVTTFLGGGLLGALLHVPMAILFANEGSFFISFLLMAAGVFFMGPWTVCDVADALSVWKDKRDLARQKRQEKQAEKAAQKALLAEEARLAELAALEAAEREQDLLQEEDWWQEDELVEPEGIPAEPVIALNEEEFPVLLVEEESPLPPTPSVDEDEEVEVNFQPKSHLAYRLPSIDLFAPVRSKSQAGEKKLVRENIKVLEDTFASFGIKVAVERAEIGPSVTKYEVKPAVGVRVNRISNLADDLALALAAKDVRIEAPIPGKSVVGIEVPNSEIATVSFRELWEQSKTDPAKLLEIPLGKAVNGQSRSFDLARMPHLLVAGSTGSGKSVAVNGIIASILMKAGPDQVKFMMIDPKMVELSVYNDIPHLLIPVVTNPRKAARALQKVVDEMEKRYELFSHIGVRNIAGYNAKVEEFNRQSEEKQIPLPLIVVIVDELADLMMVASKEVEDAIIRLGQKARAAGIHMILATQRPSVDVISGLIKANVPSRIAFAVSSGTDSRTILDENGAEKLLGRGDMLFKPIDENHPVRLQGSFISDDEVEGLVTFIKAQGQAEYDESFDPGEVRESDGDSSVTDDGSDPLFEEARALVVETQKASASMIQRRLSVGFNRATRLMEELEAAGVIGPAEGTKPRKVLETS